MSKGLRLKFYGKECTAEEVKIIAHSLGYNSSPVFGGWGRGGYRNFFSSTSSSQTNAANESLVEKGLFSVDKPPKFTTCDRVYHVTDFGKRWFSAFMHKHPHADWGTHAW